MPTHRILGFTEARSIDYAAIMHLQPPVIDCHGGLMLPSDRLRDIQIALGVETQAELVNRTLAITVTTLEQDRRHYTFRAADTYPPS